MAAMTERFELRLDEDTLNRVDRWRSEQGDLPSRAEAVRRLMEFGLLQGNMKNVRFSDGEKLLIIMLCDVLKGLKIEKGQVDPDFISSVIFGGHYWAPSWEMHSIFNDDIDDLKDLDFVTDVLEMWTQIERSHKELTPKEKTRVKREAEPFGGNVRFTGFDGNNESSLLGIARFIIEKMGRFRDFKGRELNSHMPTARGYRQMLREYEDMKQSLVGGLLGPDQIIAVLNALRFKGVS